MLAFAMMAAFEHHANTMAPPKTTGRARRVES